MVSGHVPDSHFLILLRYCVLVVRVKGLFFGLAVLIEILWNFKMLTMRELWNWGR